MKKSTEHPTFKMLADWARRLIDENPDNRPLEPVYVRYIIWGAETFEEAQASFDQYFLNKAEDKYYEDNPVPVAPWAVGDDIVEGWAEALSESRYYKSVPESFDEVMKSVGKATTLAQAALNFERHHNPRPLPVGLSDQDFLVAHYAEQIMELLSEEVRFINNMLTATKEAERDGVSLGDMGFAEDTGLSELIQNLEKVKHNGFCNKLRLREKWLSLFGDPHFSNTNPSGS